MDENRFQKFNNLVKDLADDFVRRGFCKSYIITSNGSNDLCRLDLDIKPTDMCLAKGTIHDLVTYEYTNLMHSCGITDSEYINSKGGFFWLFGGEGEDIYQKIRNASYNYKINKFNAMLKYLGEDLVSDGLCTKFEVRDVWRDSDIKNIFMYVPYENEKSFPESVRKEIIHRYYTLMYSCCITDEEQEYILGGCKFIYDSE
jgi:hypothetical protein